MATGPRKQLKAEVERSVDEIRKSPRGKGEVPALEELAELIIEAWGGKRRYVRALKRIHDKSPEGSLARQRIMEATNRIIVAASKVAVTDSTPDELLSTEQVRKKLLKLVGETESDGRTKEESAG